MEKRLVPGELYRHYKGGIYRIVAECINAENDEHTVIYENEAGEIFTRGIYDFFSQVNIWGNEYSTVRFVWVENGKNDTVSIDGEKLVVEEARINWRGDLSLATGPRPEKETPKDTVKTEDGEEFDVSSGMVDFSEHQVKFSHLFSKDQEESKTDEVCWSECQIVQSLRDGDKVLVIPAAVPSDIGKFCGVYLDGEELGNFYNSFDMARFYKSLDQDIARLIDCDEILPPNSSVRRFIYDILDAEKKKSNLDSKYVPNNYIDINKIRVGQGNDFYKILQREILEYVEEKNLNKINQEFQLEGERVQTLAELLNVKKETSDTQNFVPTEVVKARVLLQGDMDGVCDYTLPTGNIDQRYYILAPKKEGGKVKRQFGIPGEDYLILGEGFVKIVSKEKFELKYKHEIKRP